MIYALVAAVLSLPATAVGVSLVLTRFMAAQAALGASERAEYLQRIQDPQAAVAVHAIASSPDPSPYLPFEDDAAYFKHIQDMNG